MNKHKKKVLLQQNLIKNKKIKIKGGDRGNNKFSIIRFC